MQSMRHMQTAATTASTTATATKFTGRCTANAATASWSPSLASSSSVTSASRAMLKHIPGGYGRGDVPRILRIESRPELPDVQVQGMLVLQNLAAAAITASHLAATNAPTAAELST